MKKESKTRSRARAISIHTTTLSAPTWEVYHPTDPKARTLHQSTKEDNTIAQRSSSRRKRKRRRKERQGLCNRHTRRRLLCAIRRGVQHRAGSSDARRKKGEKKACQAKLTDDTVCEQSRAAGRLANLEASLSRDRKAAALGKGQPSQPSGRADRIGRRGLSVLIRYTHTQDTRNFWQRLASHMGERARRKIFSEGKHETRIIRLLSIRRTSVDSHAR